MSEKNEVHPITEESRNRNCLFESLLQPEERNIISNNQNLQPQLLAESTMNRDFHKSRISSKELHRAAKDLKE